MKKIVLIALLTTVGLAQTAHADKPHEPGIVLSEAPTTSSKKIQTDRVVTPRAGIPIVECPEGTYLTPAGHCQPDFEFD